jgi:hypothetical protein
MVWGLDMRFLGRKRTKINARAETTAKTKAIDQSLQPSAAPVFGRTQSPFGLLLCGTLENACPFHAGCRLPWMGWKKRRRLRFWLKGIEVWGIDLDPRDASLRSGCGKNQRRQMQQQLQFRAPLIANPGRQD